MDYKTVVLTFDEDIADPANDEDVVVKTLLDENEITDNNATVAVEGTNAIKVTYEKALSAGEYTFIVSGVKDKAANAISTTAPTSVKQTKDASVLDSIEFVTTELPSGYKVNTTSGLEELVGTGEGSANANVDAWNSYKGVINLKGKDQYGEELTSLTGASVKDVTVSATVGERPLFIGKEDTSTKANAGNYSYKVDGKVINGTIADSLYIEGSDIQNLKTGDTVTVTVNKKGADKPIAQKAYKLVAHKTLEATTVKSIKVMESGNEITDGKLISGKPYDLSLEWLDQYGNPMDTKDTASKTATWSVTPSTLADLTDGTNPLTAPAATAKLTPKLDVISGKLTVKAYYGSDKKAESEFEISAPAISGITVTDGFRHLKDDKTYDSSKLYSKEELTSNDIFADPVGAQLAPDDLKAVVTATDSLGADIDLTKAENKPDVKIVKAKKMDTSSGKETDEEEVNTLQVKLTPAVPGNYKVKLYAKDADITKDAALTELSTGEVKNNPILKEIKLVDTFSANEVTVGGKSGFKKVEFINVNGESIDVFAGGASALTASGNGAVSGVTLHGEDADGNPIKTPIAFSDDSTPVKYIQVTGGSVGKGGFKLQAKGDNGTEYVNVDVKVEDTAKVDRVAFTKTESSVQPIVGDTLVDNTTGKFKVTAVSGVSYTLVPVAFKNQYGGEFEVLSRDDSNDHSAIKLTGVTAKLGDTEIKVDSSTGIFDDSSASKYKVAFFDEDCGIITQADKAVKYIGITAITGADTAKAQTLSLAKTDTTEGTSTDNISVKARAVRKLDSITLDQKSTTISAGAKVRYEVTAKDQYGKAWNLKAAVDSSSNAVTINGVKVKLNSDEVKDASASKYYGDGSTESDPKTTGYVVEYMKDAENVVSDTDDIIKYIDVTAGTSNNAPTTTTAKLSLNDAANNSTKSFVSADINYVGESDVAKIDLADKEVTATSNHDTATYKNGTIYVAKKDSDANEYTIPVTAYDANGKAVTVTDDFYEDQSSTKATVTVKDKDGVVKDKLTTATATIQSTADALKLTLQGNSSGDVLAEGDTVTINLTSKTNLTDELTFKVSLVIMVS